MACRVASRPLAPRSFRAPLPVGVAVGRRLPEALRDDVAQDELPEPAAAAQPLALGILSRLSLLETSLGLPLVKPPLLRPATDARLAWAARTALRQRAAGILHRSSVGTARIPIGPPS